MRSTWKCFRESKKKKKKKKEKKNMLLKNAMNVKKV